MSQEPTVLARLVPDRTCCGGFLKLYIPALLIVTSVLPSHAQEKGPVVGQPAPSFELDLLEGGRLSLSAQRGRPVIVNFWATWCAPCRDEIPAFIDLWRANGERGLVILAVNLADQERRKDIGRFVSELGMTFPVLLDARGKVRELYHLTSVPTTVFVDSAGVVRGLHPGPISRDALDRGLASILPPR